ncbi:MAG: sulfite exporter TauE/SafE family protein [Hyphomicrobiaceae bacterium]
MLTDILLFIAIGFAAQLVDGAIGMAYGITATTILMGFGVPPATASASIHAAEVFTTAASGTAHWRMGNVDRKLIVRLAVPGMIGGCIGAYVLATVPGDSIRPIVSSYLLVMGAIIVWRAIWKERGEHKVPKHVGLLGLVGGFLDAIGGGGWGAMVTTTLIGRGASARFAIGSANVAEFFVTATVTATFVATVGLTLWPVITGLVIGGVVAAPFAAYATKHLPDRPVMILVGVVVMLLSLRSLLLALR